MDDLPIDLSHPRVRQYLSLIRLQMLSPLSLLINIFLVIACTFVPTQSLVWVLRNHPTPLSPRPLIVALYVLAMFTGQLGYCILLLLARKPETKQTLTSKGIGFSLVLANLTMALWAVTWVFEWFICSAILQGLLLLLLLYANIMLLCFHPPSSERPFDIIFIHAPMRFFFVLQFALMFPLSIFVALGLEYKPHNGDHHIDYSTTSWPAFGVILGTNLLGLGMISVRNDIAWSIAATWICISQWSCQPKPASVAITAAVFTVLHPLTILTIMVYSVLTKTGRIALPSDDIRSVGQDTRMENDGPHEVDEEDVWG